MKIFGFEVIGLQSLGVKCPKCGSNIANIVFAPSEKNTPIPFPTEIREGLDELGVTDYLSLPNCDDLHFHCMKCMTIGRHCEEFNKDCKIREKEV